LRPAGGGHRLWQVLTNLVGNANKFTSEGTITLRVRQQESGQGSRTLEFAVSDTGIGIPADKQVDIFAEFGQADAATTRNFGGTGLGLSISSKLVNLMGGQIMLESAEGRGSTFSFCLQFEEAPPAEESSTLTDEQEEAIDLAGLRVLLAEDNRVNAKLATRLLEKLDCRVHRVENGKEALEAWSTGEFDLVLMDIQMPVMGGFEATAKLREAEEGTGSRTPVIALTAHALAEYRDKCSAAGMDDYLTKPMNIKDLKMALHRWSPRPAELV
jgi:CheY-like chemotaxis protein